MHPDIHLMKPTRRSLRPLMVSPALRIQSGQLAADVASEPARPHPPPGMRHSMQCCECFRRLRSILPAAPNPLPRPAQFPGTSETRSPRVLPNPERETPRQIESSARTQYPGIPSYSLSELQD